MKKKGPTHAERREAARPEEWKPLPKVPRAAYEPPKPVKQTARKGFNAADIARLKQREAEKYSRAPAKAPGKYITVNLEDGMPSAENAVRRMETAIQGAYARGTKAIKFVHGYGSTGKGGAIKAALREQLPRLPHVKAVIPGEEFSSVKDIPFMENDPDRNRANPGITIAVLG